MESGIEVSSLLEENPAPSPTSAIDIGAISYEEDQAINSQENDKVTVSKRMRRKLSLPRSRYYSRQVSTNHANKLQQTSTKTSSHGKRLVNSRWFPISALKSKLHLRILSLNQLRQNNFQLKKKIAHRAPFRYSCALKIKKNGHSNKRRKESISKSALPFLDLETESTDDEGFSVATIPYCPDSPVLSKRKNKSTAVEEEEAARSYSSIKEDEDDSDGFVLALSLSEEEEESRKAPFSIDVNNNLTQDEELSEQLETALSPIPQNHSSIPKREESWYYFSNGKRRKYWQCDCCEYKTLAPISLASHISKKHPFSTAARLSPRCDQEPNLFQCAHCEFSTQEKYRLERHDGYHQKETDHSCKFCSFSADSVGQLEFHLNNHHSSMKKEKLNKTAENSRLFKCPECDFSTKYESNYAIHEATHKRNAEFKCSLCTYSSKHKIGVTRHSNRFHGKASVGLAERIGKKKDQRRKIGLRSTGEVPLQQISLDENNRKRKYHQCSLCNYSTNDFSMMKLHQSRHENIAAHKCPCCSYSSDFKNILTKHLRCQHPDSPESAPPQQISPFEYVVEDNRKLKHMCSLCSYSTNDFSRMNLHQIRHEKIAVHKCDYCSYSSDFKRAVTAHLRRHHPESVVKIEFECKFCDFKTSDHFQLKAHEVRHQRNLKFKCRRCNYSSNYKAAVRRHLKNYHREEKSIGISTKKSQSKVAQKCLFECNECCYSTDKDIKMDRHLLAHQGKGKFKCLRCTFSSDNQSGIYRHRNRHHPKKEILAEYHKDGKVIKKGKIKPKVENAMKKSISNVTQVRVSNGHFYECEVCTFSTSQEFHLKIHEKGHKEKGEHKCHICNFSSNFKNSITRHLRCHHLNPKRDVNFEEKNPSSYSPSKTDISLYNGIRECWVVLQDVSLNPIFQEALLNLPKASKRKGDEIVTPSPKLWKQIALQELDAEEAKCLQQIFEIEEDINCNQLKMEKIQKKFNKEKEKKTNLENRIRSLRNEIDVMLEKVRKEDEEFKEVSSKMNEVREKINQVIAQRESLKSKLRSPKCVAVDVSTPDGEMEIGNREEVESTAVKIKFLEDALGSLRKQEQNCSEDLKIAEESFIGVNQVAQAKQWELEGLKSSLKEAYSLDKSLQIQMDQLTISSDENNKIYLQLENGLLEVRERKRAQESSVAFEK